MKDMTFEEKIEHKLNNLSTSIKGLYVNSNVQEEQIKSILTSVDGLTKSMQSLSFSLKELSTKVDGDDTLDVVGLRKRVQYLEQRDKWLKNRWLQAVGAVGGITILYGLLRALEWGINFYKHTSHP